MFHEVSRNSDFIAAIFGEDMGDCNKPEIIGIDHSFLKLLKQISLISSIKNIGTCVKIYSIV